MRIRIVLALLLILAGTAALVFAAGSDSMETRLGLLMTVVGAWFLLMAGRFSRRRLPQSLRLYLSHANEGPSGQSPVGLLLAGLLITVGAIGLMARVGLRTSAELALELLLLIVGTSLFVNERRGHN
jgi:hypothetical protein